MIVNNEQYKRAKKEIASLEELIAEIEAVVAEDKEVSAELRLQLRSSYRHLEKIKKQKENYEKLTSGKLQVLAFDSSKDNMDDAIMSFRIASKKTQTKIAEMLYMQPQQVQRYEQDNYRTASFERILQLLEALEVQVILKKEFNKSYNFIIPETEEIKKYKETVYKDKQVLKVETL